MNDQVEESKAKAAIKLGILIGIIALIELICGFIYLSKGGIDGSGLWSGAGVNNCRFVLTFFSLSTVRFSEFFSLVSSQQATYYLCEVIL